MSNEWNDPMPETVYLVESEAREAAACVAGNSPLRMSSLGFTEYRRADLYTALESERDALKENEALIIEWCRKYYPDLPTVSAKESVTLALTFVSVRGGQFEIDALKERVARMEPVVSAASTASDAHQKCVDDIWDDESDGLMAHGKRIRLMGALRDRLAAWKAASGEGKP